MKPMQREKETDAASAAKHAIIRHVQEMDLSALKRLMRVLNAAVGFGMDPLSVDDVDEEASTPPLVGQQGLLDRYHALVDSELAGTLLTKDTAELEAIQHKLEMLEDAQASEDDLERRHSAMLQKLNELTSELKNLGAGGQPQARVQ
jgi:hypothetical protein